MATLTIRDLDEALKQLLRMRAASRSRSMEEEARQILRAALLEKTGPTLDLASRIRARFEPLGDIELPTSERQPVRLPPSLGDDSNPMSASDTERRAPSGGGRR